jgi:hypothetical protein
VVVGQVGRGGAYGGEGEALRVGPHADRGGAAQAVAEVASRPDRGAEIGRRGREAGARSVDRARHAGRLLDFAARLPRRSAA